MSITHLTFGREYTAAVEAKQVAQQEAERAKFLVEKAVQDTVLLLSSFFAGLLAEIHCYPSRG